ncbi:MAG: SPFH domain-containing protein [Victivallaceae bacterium]|jgi:regulator of protease activity HflC (stomatin/prohibitin superfamily)
MKIQDLLNKQGAPPNSAATVSLKAGCFIAVLALIILMVIALPAWYWYWWRIEPENGELAVLIRKAGEPLPATEILAGSPGQKGIHLEVLPEGRYFRNPYIWSWEIHKMTDIPAGKLGVKIRLFGKNLPAGAILAQDGCKGIEPDILAPGKYRLNPYAYEVLVFDAINIRPGHVGVKTSLAGKDILNGKMPESDLNAYLVGNESKGVCAEVMSPGTYYLNPYLWTVVEVNLQSQRFEMGGVEVIEFLTSDGFPVRVEGTIEFNVRREQAALLAHKVGNMEDIIKKLILPRARGFIRIEGSKKTAVEFIVGETRQQFQNDLEKHLKQTCDGFGVSINSVLIRNIIPPNDVAKIIRDRELAAQETKKFEQQIVQAKSRAELVRQEMLALQNGKKVEAETLSLRAGIGARQEQEVKKIAAVRELEVAKIDKDTTEAQARAKILSAEADRDVIRLRNEAEAAVLKVKVDAFGDGMEWARYNLYQRLAPQIKGIITSDTSIRSWLPTGGGAPETADNSKKKEAGR